MALYRFEWARWLHRELRHLLFPLTDFEIVVLAVASSVGRRDVLPRRAAAGDRPLGIERDLRAAAHRSQGAAPAVDRPARSRSGCCSARCFSGPAI
jgi:hypothetical protein